MTPQPDLSTKIVDFAAVASTTGFIGVGFNPFPAMQGGIASLCRNVVDSPRCEERHLTDYTPSEVIEDPLQPHLFNDTITVVDGYMIAQV